MSDGPYRSLQMPPRWKKACEVAQNAAHEKADLVERMRVAALYDMIASEGSTTLDTVAKIVGAAVNGTGSLVPVDELEAFRANRPLSTLHDRLIEHTIGACEGGHYGKQALEEGLRRAVSEHLEAGQRQVEEHYRRHESRGGGQDRTRRVRDNLRSACGASTVGAVVNQTIERMNGKLGQLRVRKRDAVSDGPPVPSRRSEFAHA